RPATSRESRCRTSRLMVPTDLPALSSTRVPNGTSMDSSLGSRSSRDLRLVQRCPRPFRFHLRSVSMYRSPTAMENQAAQVYCPLRRRRNLLRQTVEGHNGGTLGSRKSRWPPITTLPIAVAARSAACEHIWEASGADGRDPEVVGQRARVKYNPWI